MPRSRALLLAVAAFALAFGIRTTNARSVFQGGIPQVAPYDELYHLKRIAYSAAHFPAVLQFDRDRGIGGAFCPWPPLYDLAAGGIARLSGATAIGEVLEIAVWFPPIAFALFLAILVYVLAQRAPAAAILAGLAIAAAPPVVTASWIGAIDHHFLEPPLVVAILGATLYALRAASPLRAGLVLGCALAVALFVQTALLPACALAFVALFFLARDRRAGAIAFGLAYLAVILYRLTRPLGYPESAWFLGTLHGAMLAGAAIALLIRRRWIGLACGIAVALLHSAQSAILQGLQFFGGDPWMETIEEFRPLTDLGMGELVPHTVSAVGALVLLIPAAIRAVRRRDPFLGTVVLFAGGFLAAAIARQRFLVIAIPMLLLAGAMYAQTLLPNRHAFAIAALLVVAPPLIQLATLWRHPPPPPIGPEVRPYLRAASVVRGARVLAPWSYGHLFDVVGGAKVVIDNFGTMPSPHTFVRAHQAFLARDERDLARYCRQNDIRFVVLNRPLPGIIHTANAIGASVDPQSTWWWRVYATQPRETQFFRLVFEDSGVTVWEARPPSTP